MLWPPQLRDLKNDVGGEQANTTRDDSQLQIALDAAVDRVQYQELAGTYNFSGATTGDEALLPAPTQDVMLGTIRLAYRWRTRLRSPDGLSALGGDLGSTRVPSLDADIERLLGVGRYRPPFAL